jgi:uncharacterized protein
MQRPLLTLLPFSAVLAASAASAPGRLSGSWTGSYTLGNQSSVALAVSVSGGRAVVALGTGHADAQAVTLRGGRMAFRVPGVPATIDFDGRLRNGRYVGMTRQGTARGKFTLRRGSAPSLLARGSFGEGAGRVAVVDDPYTVPRLLTLETGELHGLFGKGPSFVVGSGWSTNAPSAGSARIDAIAAAVGGSRAARVRLRQYEVRFPSRGATLAGTLTMPTGAAPHPAVAYVAGSGATQRAYLPDLQALLVDSGVAVLAYDKRGIGQSGGRYPGESPTDDTIDTLAVDAQAAIRFVARQPAVDPAKVGLAGHSQAGWIMPLAASREPAVQFVVAFSSPAVTADETDHYQNLTGEGNSAPMLTGDQIDAQVLRDGPGGVDPLPWIRSLRIPVLWVYGGLDQHIPTRLSVRRLQPLLADQSRDFTAEVFPNANHALVETQTGLTAEMLRSHQFAPGMFAAVRAWLHAHGLDST